MKYASRVYYEVISNLKIRYGGNGLRKSPSILEYLGSITVPKQTMTSIAASTSSGDPGNDDCCAKDKKKKSKKEIIKAKVAIAATAKRNPDDYETKDLRFHRMMMTPMGTISAFSSRP